MENRKILLIVLVVLLVVSNLFFAGIWFLSKKELNLHVVKEQTDKNILSFTDLFIQKVINTNGVVSFEDRLKLENAVRGLNDKDIFNEWEKMTAVKDPTQAQQELNTFLQLLVNKASQ